MPAADDVVTIEPPPVCFMAKAACLIPQKTPLRLTWMIFCHVSSLVSSNGTAQPPTRSNPALLYITSSGPSSSTARATSAANISLVADISLQPDRLDTGGAQRRHRGVDAITIDIGHHQSGAVLAEQPGSRQAEAAPAPVITADLSASSIGRLPSG